MRNDEGPVEMNFSYIFSPLIHFSTLRPPPSVFVLLHLVLLFTLLVFSSVPSAALSKGLLDAEPVTPVTRAPVTERGANVDIHYIPQLDEGPKTKEELAIEIGSQIGRLAESWADGTSLPLLGGMVGGVVRMSRRAAAFGDHLKDQYGISVRSHNSGVAVMMRRRF
jgi:hypothetical protein